MPGEHSIPHSKAATSILSWTIALAIFVHLLPSCIIFFESDISYLFLTRSSNYLAINAIVVPPSAPIKKYHQFLLPAFAISFLDFWSWVSISSIFKCTN